MIVKYINGRSRVNYRLYAVQYVKKQAILTPVGASAGQTIVKMSVTIFEQARRDGYYVEQK